MFAAQMRMSFHWSASQNTVLPNQFPVRREADVEARGVDHDVKLPLARRNLDPVLNEAHDLVALDLDILLAQRFQVALARSGAATIDRPLGNDILTEPVVMVQSLSHRFGAGLKGRLLVRRVLEKRVEELVQIMLVILPVFEQGPRLLAESALFLLRVLEILPILGQVCSEVGRDPGRAPDVRGDMAGCLLHLRQDLDRRRSVANDRDSLAGPVEVRIPSGAVHLLPLVGVDAGNVGPASLAGDTGSVHQDVCLGLDDCSLLIDFHSPFSGRFV